MTNRITVEQAKAIVEALQPDIEDEDEYSTEYEYEDSPSDDDDD